MKKKIIPAKQFRDSALDFFKKYKGWHTYAGDQLTERVIAFLVYQGFIEINNFHQARGI